MSPRPRILLASLLSLGVLLAGCKDAAVYSQESFAADSPYKLRVKSKVDAACESVRRALLGQGYLIDEADAGKVKGRKTYQSNGDRNNLIEMNVVCVTERRGSTLFATGVLSTYELKTSGSSASVGVSAVGSISLPIGKSADSLVKVGEQTISDSEFYRRFFTAVELTLAEIEESDDPGEAPPAPAPIPPEPGPAAVDIAAPAPVTAAPGPVMSGTGPLSAPVPAGTPQPVPATGAPATAVVPGALSTGAVVPIPGPAVAQPAPAPDAISGPVTSSEALPIPGPAPQSGPMDPGAEPLGLPVAMPPALPASERAMEPATLPLATEPPVLPAAVDTVPEPGTAGVAPGSAPAEPGTAPPAEPGTPLTEPGTSSTASDAAAAAPGAVSTEPGTATAEPGAAPTEPGAAPAGAVAGPRTKPAAPTGVGVVTPAPATAPPGAVEDPALLFEEPTPRP